jgi:hypothetical protein
MYKSKYSNLIQHLINEHDLILLDSEIQEIENFVDKDLEAIDVIQCCMGEAEQLPTGIEVGKMVSDLANLADDEMER